MKSTLNKDLIEPYRRCGNTTRQVDFAIQLLFSGEDIKVEDHHKDGKDFNSNLNLFRKIVKRLQLEHGDYFNINRSDLTITWKQ